MNIKERVNNMFINKVNLKSSYLPDFISILYLYRSLDEKNKEIIKKDNDLSNLSKIKRMMRKITKISSHKVRLIAEIGEYNMQSNLKLYSFLMEGLTKSFLPLFNGELSKFWSTLDIFNLSFDKYLKTNYHQLPPLFQTMIVQSYTKYEVSKDEE